MDHMMSLTKTIKDQRIVIRVLSDALTLVEEWVCLDYMQDRERAAQIGSAVLNALDKVK